MWPEAVDNLASAVRAGMSLPEALTALGHRGPEPLREPFLAFGADYQVTGRFGDSLDRLKVRLADPVGDRVVEGLRIAREVGGGELGSLLRNLSGFLREDARTRSELESRQAWTVNGARLAVAAPWLVLLMLCFQREVIARYASPAGVLVLAVGGGLCLVAYRTMVRIGRLPTEQRVLVVTPAAWGALSGAGLGLGRAPGGGPRAGPAAPAARPAGAALRPRPAAGRPAAAGGHGADRRVPGAVRTAARLGRRDAGAGARRERLDPAAARARQPRR